MANAEGYEEKQVVTRNGHGIKMVINYPNFVDMLPIHFEKKFTLCCQDVPTSWSLRWTFQREPNNGDVSCKVVINRTDRIGFGLLTNIWMRMNAPFVHNFVPSSANLVAPGMEPNVQARRTVTGLVPKKFLLQLGNQDLELVFYCLFRGCHKNKELDVIGEFIPPNYEHRMSISSL